MVNNRGVCRVVYASSTETGTTSKKKEEPRSAWQYFLSEIITDFLVAEFLSDPPPMR